jgi:hypothetical protein
VHVAEVHLILEHNSVKQAEIFGDEASGPGARLEVSIAMRIELAVV